MSKRDPYLFLIDMMESIEKVERYTAGLAFDEFEANDMVLDAVVRNLEIIGEAAGRLPESIRSASSDIEWRKMVGMRNLLAHEYFGVSLPVV